jgi:uncharacterized protein
MAAETDRREVGVLSESAPVPASASGAVSDAAFGPVREGDRLASLDVIRGVALLGILVVNMNWFGGPFGRAIFDATLADASFAAKALWWFENTFFTGKFVSIFSFLFGAGLALQMARLDCARAESAARGERSHSTAFTILRRLFILGIVGLCHALLIWYGDILFLYALLGWILIPLRHLSQRGLAIVATALLVLSATCVAGMGALQVWGMRMAEAQAAAAYADAEEMEGEFEYADDAGGIDDLAMADAPPSRSEMTGRERLWELIRAGDIDPASENLMALETEIYRNGPFLDALALRAFQWTYTIPFLVITYGPHTLGFFVLGMWAMRSGFFRRESARPQILAAAICLPLGVLLCATASSLIAGAGFDPSSWSFALAAPIGDAGATLLAIGYAGALARLAALRFDRSMILRPIANAGRMAFTVYLSMSVLMTGLMYWWGLGFFGSFERGQHMLIALGTWTALVVASTLWLSRFRMGPLEWLWRAGTYLEVPRLRRGRA